MVELLFSAEVVFVCDSAGSGRACSWATGVEVCERGGRVYLEVTSGAGEERECWDWGLAEGVGGWAGLVLRLPLVPDLTICC